jgi:hypothetical protein
VREAEDLPAFARRGRGYRDGEGPKVIAFESGEFFRALGSIFTGRPHRVLRFEEDNRRGNPLLLYFAAELRQGHEHPRQTSEAGDGPR